MSFHGGLVGVLTAMWVYGRIIGRTMWQVTDFVAPLCPLGLGFGRIGNFINNGTNGNDIEVKAEKLVFRSYMYADDLVEWLLAITVNANSTCPIYNVGSDNEIEIRDLAYIISQIFNIF